MTQNQVVAASPLNATDAYGEDSRLRGYGKYRVYRQMLESDGQVAGAFAALTAPVSSARWSWRWEGRPDARVAAYLERAYDRDWPRRLERILHYLAFGTMALQQTFVVEGRTWWPILTTRSPDTWWRWYTDDEGRPAELEVAGYSGDARVRVRCPVGQLWLWTHRPASDQDLHGQAMLRPLYRHWAAKWKLDQIRTIGHERYAMGTPVVRYRRGAEGVDELEAAVRNLRMHERGYLMVPDDLVESAADVMILERSGGGDASLNETIRYHDLQIASALMSQWITIGTGETGSRAAGQVHVEMALRQAAAVAGYIGQVYTEMVSWAVRANFGGDAPMPKWEAPDIAEPEPGAVVSYVTQLAAAGLLTRTPEVEDWLRRRIGAPARPASAPVEPEGSGTMDTDVTALAAVAGTWRALTPTEAACLDVVAMAADRADLDAEGVAAVEQWTIRARAQAARYLEPRIRAQDFAGIAAFKVGGKRELQDILVDIALRAAALGRREARSEIARQAGVRASVPDAVAREAAFAVAAGSRCRALAEVAAGRMPRGLLEPIGGQVGAWARAAGLLSLADDPSVSMQRITAAAKARADRIAAEVQSEAIAAAIAAASKTPPDLATFDELLTRGAKMATVAAVSEVVGAGIAAGRADAQDAGVEIGGEVLRPSRWLYSAILDKGTCGVCAAADGTEATSRDGLPPVPNPECEGTAAMCRCVHIGVIS